MKIGPYVAMVSAPNFAWTGRRSPSELFKAGDLALFKILDITGSTARVELEQQLTVQGAFLAIDNSSGEIKAMVGGSSFEESNCARSRRLLRNISTRLQCRSAPRPAQDLWHGSAAGRLAEEPFGGA